MGYNTTTTNYNPLEFLLLTFNIDEKRILIPVIDQNQKPHMKSL